ncbi:hypothetical protein [Fibrella aquatilis]|uniref:Lipoprotein n=1 Tax=Fibrella aquatilis TaxID=2817059 RepID=A0A939G0A9_9BACT|nr:hypothetical protein [Fibrella aquatilis]MBO0930027.1 hypothetical protein [Fibrella aquatilis]
MNNRPIISSKQRGQRTLILVILSMLTGCRLLHSRGGFCGVDRAIMWSDFATPANPTQEINGEDRIRLIETPIQDPRRLIISFEAQPPVRWWKRVSVLDGDCRLVPGGRLETEGDRAGPVTITLTLAQANRGSFLISKAKFLGIHTGMYNTPKDLHTKMGKSLRFIWEKD